MWTFGSSDFYHPLFPTRVNYILLFWEGSYILEVLFNCLPQRCQNLGVVGELGTMFHIRRQGLRSGDWTSYILLEDFHFSLVLQVMFLSYILTGSKNVYPAPNISVIFIDPLETSYAISLFYKTLNLPHAPTWRSLGINFSTDSKYQSKTGLCLRVSYDGSGICRQVSQIMITFIQASSFWRNTKTLLLSANLYS